MKRDALKNSLNPINAFNVLKFKFEDYKKHPLYMRTFGSCVFCGAQGEGKTLSAVQYVLKARKDYPISILVTNVAIKDYPFNAYLKKIDDENFAICLIENDEEITTEILLQRYKEGNPLYITLEYDGLGMLKHVSNAEYGVIYLVDEIHLELNSLESANIDIDVMVEISQQRKQRKHIVGTSQIFMRLAKPMREQIHDIVLCKCYFGLLQFNKWILGETAVEKDGKLEAKVKGRFLWFHAPDMYSQYDTYCKMRRYNKEWKGRKRVENIYERSVPIYEP